MRTHQQTSSRPGRRAKTRRAPSRPTAAPLSTRAIASLLAVVLCTGFVPLGPAWADNGAATPETVASASEQTAAADDSANLQASPNADPSTNAADASDAPAANAGTDAGATSPSANAATEALPAAGASGTPDASGAADTSDASGAVDGTTSTQPSDPIATPTVPTPSNPLAGTDDGVPVADNPHESDAAGKTVDQYFPTDEKAAAKLRENLTARFSKDGDDGKLSADTVDAAIALNSLGKGADIDTDALITRLAKDEKEAGGTLTLGQYGRYIMALTAGGIDCTQVKVGTKTRNLVLEMEKITAETDPTIEEAVYLLPVYGNDDYRHTSGLTPDGLIKLILSAQDEEGFFWADEKAPAYSVPLTSQAMLALIPYRDDETVAAALASTAEGLYDAQLIDGSWPADGLSLEGSVPATAYATAALVAMGADPEKDLKTSNESTPLGYLTAHADKGLDGYADTESIEKADEPSAAAVVLMALAANEGYSKTEKAFDVYDVQKVKRAAESSATTTKAKTTPTRSTTTSTRSAAKTIPQSGDELPIALGLTGCLAVAALALALIARRRLSER